MFSESGELLEYIIIMQIVIAAVVLYANLSHMQRIVLNSH